MVVIIIAAYYAMENNCGAVLQSSTDSFVMIKLYGFAWRALIRHVRGKKQETRAKRFKDQSRLSSMVMNSFKLCVISWQKPEAEPQPQSWLMEDES